MNRIQMRGIFAVLILTMILAYERVEAQANKIERVGEEKYRPQYHFSPKKGWIGDPDGLVFSEKKYHLFWWGHATSYDLVHWQELPHPMQGDDGSFSYFSGSVVVDKNNTSGFGINSMVAIYTRHFRGDSLPETQALSVSNDGGLTFQYYKDNPVLDINEIFFRDPQVFWHEGSKLWKMVVSLPDVHQIQIYESKDLKEWKYCSTFEGLGAQSAFWECPDLFELPVLGSTEKKWVMLIGRGPNRVQYFVGDFDGNVFKPDSKVVEYLKNGEEQDGERAMWLDYGLDYYATRTWRNYDENEQLKDTVIAIGWMGNWDYANKVPTSWGKGFQSLPRTMVLKRHNEGGYRILQQPINALKDLRQEVHQVSGLKVEGIRDLKEFKPARNSYEMDIEFKMISDAPFGLYLLEGEGRKLILRYDPIASTFCLDRTNCTDFVSDSVFTDLFAKEMYAPLDLREGRLRLRIFVDQSSIEVFTNDGEVVLSATTFPSEKQLGIKVFSDGGAVEIASLKAWELKSIWH